MGWTSQAGVAMAPGECLACQPLVGDVMRWKDQTDQCEFECVHAGAVRRGGVCVPARWVCGLEGLVRQLLDTTSSSCVPQVKLSFFFALMWVVLLVVTSSSCARVCRAFPGTWRGTPRRRRLREGGAW